MTNMYRQGDLLFVQIGNLEALVEQNGDLNKKKVVEDGILARGEATGHAHRIASEDLALGKAKVFSDGPQRLIIEAYEQVRVTHEEHGPITLPAGQYEVRRQREYTPEAVRPVYD